VTWVNSGTVNNAGSILADWPSSTGFDSIINNGVFHITANGTALLNLGGGSGLLSNAGTLAKTAGTGTSIFDFPVANTGKILAQTGTLSFTGGVTNSTTMEATAGGNLTIGGPVHNIGAVIAAVGAVAVVTLAGTVFGGTLTASAGGSIDTAGSNGTLDGVGLHPITLTALTLLGAIVNDSTINVAAGTTITSLLIGSQASPLTTLEGTGVVNLAPGSALYSNNDYVLINQTNTIEGAGQLGDSELSFENVALVNANQTLALVLDTSSGAFASNTRTLESTSTGGLVIRSAIDDAVGTVQALTAGSHVDLAGGTIRGGTLRTANGGVIQTTTANPGGLDGSVYGVLNNTGLVKVNDQSTLTLGGTIVNTGTIFEDATTTSGITDIELVSHVVTLVGSGQLLMSNKSSNLVSGNTEPNADYLVNQGNTISGAGNFGGGSIQYVNVAGSIVATGTTALTIDPNGLGTGVNDASMIAMGSGGMVLSQGIFTNNGTMIASDGSAITFQQAAINTNLAEGDLVGGVWEAVGHGATLSMTGGPIVDAAATIVLQGAGTTIQAGSGTGGTPYTPVEQTLTMVAASGLLDVVSGRGWAGTQSLTVAGILEFAGGTFHASALTIASGGLLEGYGVIATSVANSALVESFAAGTLTITGNVSGTGALVAESGTVLSLDGASNTAGVVEDDGTLALVGSALHVNSVTIAAGALFTAAGTALEVGNIGNAGRIEALAGAVLPLNGTVTGAGTLQSDAGANLGLTRPGNTAGAVVDNGLVGVSGGLTVSGNLTGTAELNVSPASTVKRSPSAAPSAAPAR
jgi:hypothetical protein